MLAFQSFFAATTLASLVCAAPLIDKVSTAIDLDSQSAGQAIVHVSRIDDLFTDDLDQLLVERQSHMIFNVAVSEDVVDNTKMLVLDINGGRIHLTGDMQGTPQMPMTIETVEWSDPASATLHPVRALALLADLPRGLVQANILLQVVPLPVPQSDPDHASKVMHRITLAIDVVEVDGQAVGAHARRAPVMDVVVVQTPSAQPTILTVVPHKCDSKAIDADAAHGKYPAPHKLCLKARLRQFLKHAGRTIAALDPTELLLVILCFVSASVCAVRALVFLRHARRQQQQQASDQNVYVIVQGEEDAKELPAYAFNGDAKD